MDKENKYYEIIKSMVINHKKYSGLEQILDEIIDDVFSHSEVIINSVNNSEVIHTYLGKVVSTSMITVPKRLNMVNSTHNENNAIKRNHDLVDKMINATAESETNKYKENLSNETTNEIYSDNTLEEDSNTLVEPLNNDTEIKNINSDTNLVEKLEDNADSTNIENDTIQNIEYIDSDELIEDSDNEQEECENISLDNDTDKLEINSETNDLDVNLTAEFEEPINENNEVEINLYDDETTQENLDEENELSIEVEEDDDNFTEDVNMEDSFNITEDLLEDDDENTLDISDNDVAEITYENNNNNETEKEDDKSSDKELYNAFKFSIENEKISEVYNDYDVEMLSKDLAQLDQKHPELYVNSIYNLKYKSNKTVSDIAIELNIDEEKVINTLNEIIAII